MKQTYLKVSIYYDYICPWCYIGQIVAKRLQSEYGALLDWKPFLLHPHIPLEGKFMTQEERESKFEMFEKVTQIANANNLPIVFPNRMIYTKLAIEATEYARERGRVCAFNEAVFHKIYGKGKDISNWEVLAQVAVESGLDPEDMRRRVEGGNYTEFVEKQFIEAEERGIDSLPTYILNDSYAIVGAQPFEVFELVLDRMTQECR